MNRRNAQSARGGWWFLAAVAALYAVSAAFAPAVALRALAHAWQALHDMLPVLALLFVLLFVFDLVLSPKQVARYLGRPGGARGWLLALAAGILSAGPVYPWYPLLAELKGKGMRASAAAVFLYARAIKLPLLPLMVRYFDTNYSVVLSLYLAGFALLSGFVVERIDQVAQ